MNFNWILGWGGEYELFIKDILGNWKKLNMVCILLN